MPPPRPPLVLAYHGIGDVPLRLDPDGHFVQARELARHVARLRAWGYELVSFGKLAERVAAGEAAASAAVTFDDGLAGDLDVLSALGVPATFFVVSGWLGGRHPDLPSARILAAGELQALERRGFEIGSHTRTHPDLSLVDYAAALTELAGSKHALEDLLQRSVEVASYPYGRAGTAAVRACRDAGYRAACCAGGFGEWSDAYRLPRQDMNRGATMIGLRLKRDDRYEPLVRRLPGRAVRALTRRLQLLRE
jgi:peptidoglycan/xylan/chitin deacetylase (PgdA/CDA1 family)